MVEMESKGQIQETKRMHILNIEPQSSSYIAFFHFYTLYNGKVCGERTHRCDGQILLATWGYYIWYIQNKDFSTNSTTIKVYLVVVD